MQDIRSAQCVSWLWHWTWEDVEENWPSLAETWESERSNDKLRRNFLTNRADAILDLCRDPNTCPYAHAEIKLEDKRVPFVAASFIPACKANAIRRNTLARCEYMMSQAPTRDTRGHFWALLQQCARRNERFTVVALTNEHEGEKELCERYWPLPGETMTDPVLGLDVSLVREEVVPPGQPDAARPFLVEREFQLRSSVDTVCVRQLHLVNWQDRQDVDLQVLVQLLQRMDAYKSAVPFLVHCSFGIGRASVVVLAHHLCREASSNPVDIHAEIADFRFYRRSFLPDLNRLRLVFQAVCRVRALRQA